MASKQRLRPLARAVMRTQSDDRLIALAREGHDTAFEEIVRRYRPALVAFASAYVAPDLAEDVVQESLENSWKSLLGTEAEIALKPWLYTIVRNRALNAKRDTRVHDPVDEGLAGARTPPEVVLERDQLDRVLAAVGALAPAQRRALVASAFEGRTHDQIAAALGTSPGSVRGLIHRARSTVREGAGLLLPLPLVRGLSELASDPAAAEGAVGVATAGFAGAGALAGGGIATKTATLVAVATVAAGAGVAIEESLRDENRTARAVGERAAEPPDRGSAGRDGGPAPGAPAALGGDDRDDDVSGELEPAEREQGDDDNSGPGPSGENETEDLDDRADNSGPGSVNSGSGSTSSGSTSSGSGDDGAGELDVDNSGPGSDSSGSGDGSGSSGSGSSGSGSSGSGSGELELDDLELESSGPGSGELELDD